MSNTINLNTLEPQQLLSFKSNVSQELNHLQSSYDALLLAQSKYNECIKNVDYINNVKDNKQTLIPLTSSLYIPGNIKKNNFKIDIGTGYYIEKDAKDSKEFFKKRINKLGTDSNKLQDLIKEKITVIQKIDSIVKEKLSKAQTAKRD